MSKKQMTLKIEGMTCGHCENFVRMHLEDLKGVNSAEVSHKKGVAHVELDDEQITGEQIADSLDSTPYKVLEIA